MWLYAPEKIKKNTKVNLVPIPNEKVKGSKLIKDASELTVLLQKLFIHKSYDPPEKITDKLKFYKNNKGTTNDLLIATTYQSGTSPTVQKFHRFYAKRKIRRIEGPFYQAVVASYSDFRGSYFILTPQIYDIDKYDDIIDGIEQGTSILEKTAGLFPVISTYVDIGSKVGKAVVKLIDKMDKDDEIIEDTVRLYSSDAIGSKNNVFDVLQTGNYVCFDQEPDENLKIDQDLVITTEKNKIYKNRSYVIYSIIDKMIEEPEQELDQKIANLLSELNGKGNSTKSAIDFLRETIDGYSSFKKLDRVQGLMKKSKRSPEEEKLLKKLLKDKSINKFLKDTNIAKSLKQKKGVNLELRTTITRRIKETSKISSKRSSRSSFTDSRQKRIFQCFGY